jgi:hypothetical protein
MSSHQSIAELAYRLWIERRRPHGSEEEDWLEAERQLTALEDVGQLAARVDVGQFSGRDDATDHNVDSSLEATFPASDPPASHLPDSPPANAGAKWEAAAEAAE